MQSADPILLTVVSGYDRIDQHLVESYGRLIRAVAEKTDSFSEFLLQSLQNPVNLATLSVAAKTASDAPYLLTE